MKTLILTIIAFSVLIYLVVTIYGGEPMDETEEQRKQRQFLNDWQDNDNNLNED